MFELMLKWMLKYFEQRPTKDRRECKMQNFISFFMVLIFLKNNLRAHFIIYRKCPFMADVGGQGQRKSGQLCLVLVRPDRQTTDRFFLKIRTKSRQRTESRQKNPDRKTSDRKSGQNPDTRQTPDRIFRKIRTKTRQDTDSAVRRRLLPKALTASKSD